MSSAKRYDLLLPISLAAALTAAGLAGLAVQMGILTGIPALISVVVTWLALPSARRLSRRVALNGAIGLGLIPILWWVRLPIPGRLGHFGILLAVAVAVLAYHLVRSSTTRAVLVPTFAWSDTLLALIAAALAWLFLPFRTFSAGVASVSMLRYGYGGDNVAHFDMFEMIRRYGGAGPTWPISPDGTYPAYYSYPQHFHSLVSFAAEVWHGVDLASVDQETGLFGIGMSLVLSAATLTLVAAILSIRALRRHPGFAVAAGTLAVAFLLLGLGAQAIPFGFPNFLLATICSLIAIVIAIDGRRSILGLLAVGSMVLLVAHSWSLLTTMPAIGLLFVVLRLPWREWRQRVAAAAAEVLILIITFAGVVYAAALVEVSTRAEGSAAEALAIPGAVPQAPITAALAVCLAALAVAVSLRWGFGKRHSTRQWLNAAGIIGTVAAVALGETLVLFAVQFRTSPNLGYFQYKFVIGVSLILAVVLAIAVALWIARVRPVSGRPRVELVSTVALALMGAGVFSYAVLPSVASPTLDNFRPVGYLIRTDLQVKAQQSDPAIERLVAAASLMSKQPCARPIFFDPAALDGMSEANQWAMALSGKWTVATGEINSYIFDRTAERSPVALSETVRVLLTEDPGRCLIMSSGAIDDLTPAVQSEFRSSLLAYDH